MRTVAQCLLATSLLLFTSCDSSNTLTGPGPWPDSGWYLLYPQPQANTLLAACSPDASTVVAVGDAATIMRSTDAGSRWTVLHTDALQRAFLAVDIEGPFGLAVGLEGLVYRSTDGGASWTRTDIQSRTDGFRSVDVISGDTAVVVGTDEIVCRTDDRGATWSVSSIRPGSLSAVSFFDQSHGMAATFGRQVYWTGDGGVSWSERPIPFTAVTSNDVVMTGQRAALVAGSADDFGSEVAAVFITTDAGVNWSMVKVGEVHEAALLTMTSPSTGFLVAGAKLWRTVDGGWNWEAAPAGLQVYCQGMEALTESIVVRVGQYGYMARTVDGGMSWEKLTRTANPSAPLDGILRVRFTEDATGYAAFVGGRGGGGLFRTDDGAESWTRVGAEKGASDVCFAGATGIALHPYNDAQITHDGGAVWAPLAGIEDMVRVHLIEGGYGLGTGQSGYIRRTTDGGRSWDAPVVSPAGYILGRPYLIDRNVALVVGQQRELFRTTSGGTTSWTTMTTPDQIVNLDFNENRSVGIAVGYSVLVERGSIMRTVDRGQTWTVVATPDHTLSAVRFVDALTVYVAGEAGTIQKSTDGGLTWQDQERVARVPISDIFFTDAQTGYAVGPGGLVLRTTSGGD